MSSFFLPATLKESLSNQVESKLHDLCVKFTSYALIENLCYSYVFQKKSLKI